MEGENYGKMVLSYFCITKYSWAASHPTWRQSKPLTDQRQESESKFCTNLSLSNIHSIITRRY